MSAGSINARLSRTVLSRSGRGFTLVELLVVIGIIALLMSILLPTLGRVREQANSTKCRANLRSLAQAFIMYAKDNRDLFPAGARYPATGGSGQHMKSYDWIWYQTNAYPPNRPQPDVQQSAIAQYLGIPMNLTLLRCPSDNWEERQLNGSNTEPYKFSYAMNAYLECRPEGNVIVKTVQIRNQTMKILLAEEDENSINDGLWSPGDGNIDSTTARDLLAIRHDRAKSYPDPRDQQISSHINGRRSGNVVFVDGHTEFIPRTEAHHETRLKREK